MSKHERGGARHRRVAELMIKGDSVALHLRPETERARVSNRLVKLPLDPVLGVRDPNFRVARVMEVAAQTELDRQWGEAT